MQKQILELKLFQGTNDSLNILNRVFPYGNVNKGFVGSCNFLQGGSQPEAVGILRFFIGLPAETEKGFNRTPVRINDIQRINEHRGNRCCNTETRQPMKKTEDNEGDSQRA